MSDLRIGELFSGYGGLGMGVQAVYGGTIAWHSDIDKGACKVLAHRYPDVPNLGDITTVDWSTVEPVDILTGGSPCQDLSHAGRRAGMTEGTRSNLWVAMREAIAQLRPGMVVWENVRGAYSAAADSEVEPCPGCVGDGSGVHLRALGRVLGDLSDLGYDCRWHGLRAADVGAPHGRFRVFVVATDTRERGREWWPSVSGPGRLSAERGEAVNPAGNGGGAPVADTHRAGLSSVGRLDTIRRDADGRGRADEPRATAERTPLLPRPRTSDTNGAGAHGDGGLDLRTAVSMLPTPTTRDSKGHNQRHDDTCLTGALLPMPRAGDGEKGGPNQRGSSGDLMLPSAVTHLLPTPAVNDMGEGKTVEAWDEWTAKMKAAHGNGNGHGASLAIEAQRLLPTPRSAADRTGRSAATRRDSMSAPSLGQAIEIAEGVLPREFDSWDELPASWQPSETATKWGQYAAAIARWEHLTRTAPAPTERGAVRHVCGGDQSCVCTGGSPRLAAAFSEWLMGLPAGWITDVPGITRNEALKLAGNGVVPQQAAEALRVMASWTVAA